jgi:hypothetical protein
MIHKKYISADKIDEFIKYKRSLSYYDFSLYHLNGNEKGLKHSLEILFPFVVRFNLKAGIIFH